MTLPNAQPGRKVTALYVHVPFCVHKCGYCDFNSWAEEARTPQLQWCNSVESQLSFFAEALPDWQISSVFFGGGTPSLLEDDILLRILKFVGAQFSLTENCEWTVECNPETLTPEKLEALAHGGANRLSVGIQSFNDRHLQLLERRARKEDNLRALGLLQEHWPMRWSADLMFGLPHQTLQQSFEDLEIALEHGMKHLSAYQLTLGTQRSKAWNQPPEDELLKMFDQCEEHLSSRGLKRYEVSNFAVPGEESRHNLQYWRLGSFIGVGPGAAGLLSGELLDDLQGAIESSANLHVKTLPKGWGRFGTHQKQPDSFQKWQEQAASNPLGILNARAPAEHLEELLMMGLRLKEGVPRGRISQVSGLEDEIFSKQESLGFLRKNDKYWSVTPSGLRLLDSVLEDCFEKIQKLGQQDLDLGEIDPNFI